MPHSKYGPKVIRFYNSAKWKHCREEIIARNRGLCQMCKKRPGTEVHHIIPLTDLNVDNDEIAIGDKNLMLLCKQCHDSIRKKGSESMTVCLFDANGNAVVVDNVLNKDSKGGKG